MFIVVKTTKNPKIETSEIEVEIEKITDNEKEAKMFIGEKLQGYDFNNIQYSTDKGFLYFNYDEDVEVVSYRYLKTDLTNFSIETEVSIYKDVCNATVRNSIVVLNRDEHYKEIIDFAASCCYKKDKSVKIYASDFIEDYEVSLETEQQTVVKRYKYFSL